MTSPTPHEATRGATDELRARLPRSTQRCLLRPIRGSDLPAVHSYRGQPQIAQYLGHPPLTLAGAGELVERWLGDPAGLTIAAGPCWHRTGRPGGTTSSGACCRGS